MKPKMTKNFLLAGIALAASLASVSNAAIIVDYQHTGGSATPDTAATGISSSASLGGELSGGTIATSINQLSAGQPEGLPNNAGTTYNYYFSYMVEVEAGYSGDVTFESLTIDTAAKETTRLFQISYLTENDLGNVVETFIVGDWTNPEAITDGTRTADTYDFSDFTTSSDVEFRVYWGGNATKNSESRVYVDSFTLDGTVSLVPELSSSFMAMGLAVTGLMSRRRSKR